jgi:hypothetical protein
MNGGAKVIVDSHFHLGHVPSFRTFDISIERHMTYMDRLHISHCLNIHSRGLLTDEPEAGMEESVLAYERSGGRILSFYTYNPNHPERSIRLMEQYPQREIFKAVKLHPSVHGVSADDPRYEAAWSYASSRKLPIMSHTWTPSSYNPSQKLSYPPLFEKYIAKYPDVRFICGHAGGRHDGMMRTIELARRYGNVYMDTAGDVYLNRYIEYLAVRVGSERILFGSDGFWIDARTQLGMIFNANITLKEKENILFRNARRLFQIETP